MKNPERIDRIIDKLRTAWHGSPDLRLGQLVHNLVDSYVRRNGYRKHLLQATDEEVGETLSLFLKGCAVQEPALRAGSPCVTAASAVNAFNGLIEDPEKRQVIEDLFDVYVRAEPFSEDPRVYVREAPDGRHFLTVLGLLNLLFPPVVIEGKERGAISSVYEVNSVEGSSQELGANLVNFQETTPELLKRTGSRDRELSPDEISIPVDSKL